MHVLSHSGKCQVTHLLVVLVGAEDDVDEGLDVVDGLVLGGALAVAARDDVDQVAQKQDALGAGPQHVLHAVHSASRVVLVQGGAMLYLQRATDV